MHACAQAVLEAQQVAEQGIKILRKDIAVTVYALFVFLLVLMTIPLVNGLLLAAANGLSSEPIFASQHHIAKTIFVAVAVIVSTICAAMLLSYFTCAVAASSLAQLQGHPAPLLKGLSSLSLSMAQLAPVILSEDKSIVETVQHSMETLGKAWREGVVIKIAIYATILGVTLSIGFLPTLVQTYWFFGNNSAEVFSRFTTILLVICLLITAKVLGTVFTTALYWKITKEPKE
jgi:phage-related holin